jgi:hypothetical protein
MDVLNCCTRIFCASKYAHYGGWPWQIWKHGSSLNTNLSASSCRRSWNSKQNYWRRLCSSGVRPWNSWNRYGLQASLLRRIRQTVTWEISNSRLARRVDFWGLLVKDSRVRSTVSGDGPGLPVLFAAHKQPVSSNFLHHSTNKLRGPSPQANYTDRASAACRRS